MKKYIKVKENPAKVTHLKIELYYDLGGMNYFTGRAETSGYMLPSRTSRPTRWKKLRQWQTEKKRNI